LGATVADLLPDASPASDSVPDDYIRMLFETCTRNDRPALLQAVWERWDRDLVAGASRHMLATDCACQVAREALAGFYGMRYAMSELRKRFIAAATYEVPGRVTRTPDGAGHEFYGIMAWSIGQALVEDIPALRMRVFGTKPFDPFDPSTGPPPVEAKPVVRQPVTEKASERILENLVRDGSFPEVTPDGEDVTEASIAEQARELRRAQLLATAIERREIDAEARRFIRRQARKVPPNALTLAEILSKPMPPVMYRVEGLLPENGRAILSAPRKAGKTTFIVNLIKALADGGKFLDRFGVTSPIGNIVLLDFEMSESQLHSWYSKAKIATLSKVIVNTLRGHSADFDIIDDKVRAEWVAKIRSWDCEILIIDCLRPILDGIGLDENSEAGRFLESISTLMDEADIKELILVHHAGHVGERSRGDSRLRDWPDAEWRIIRPAPKDGTEPGPDDPRFFGAEGRDVGVTERQISFNNDTGRMVLLDGEGTTRKDARAEQSMHELQGRIVTFLRTMDEPVSTKRIKDEVPGRSSKIDECLLHLKESGLVKMTKTGSANMWEVA